MYNEDFRLGEKGHNIQLQDTSILHNSLIPKVSCKLQ